MSSVDGLLSGLVFHKNYEVDIDVIDALRRCGLSRKNVAEEYRDDCDQQNFYSTSQRPFIFNSKKWSDWSAIEFVDECTFDSHRFHSHRRDGIKQDENMYWIVIVISFASPKEDLFHSEKQAGVV